MLRSRVAAATPLVPQEAARARPRQVSAKTMSGAAMSIVSLDPPSPSCPDRGTLEAFHLGNLPEAELEALAAHIADCPTCSSVLETLARGQTSDTLLDQLRQCVDEPAMLHESGCARLEVVARAISLSPSPQAASTQAESNSAPVALAGTATGTADSAAPRERPLPATVGAYEVLATLGEGGMGVVYKARHQTLQRLAALKMISAGAHAGNQARARFRVEGQAIARLRHPHVVQIFDFDEHEGLPFYAMELLEGGSLADRLARGPLEPAAAAELVEKLAAAVQYAHQEQVVHRDLKPANILLTETGEPKIADFGLAKLLDSDDGHTRSEMALGTPSYMAPEQAAGHSATVGPAVDVYALGAILYQALTGRPPFRGKDRAETLRQVCEQEPVRLSQQRREVPRVLEAICLRCLEKNPARRYAAAAALADDLGRWRRGEPTVVRPPRWPVWLGRWLRRVAGVLGVCVVGYTVTLAVLYVRDPQRTVEHLQRQLQQGRPLELIAETGEPAWYRWQVGKNGSSVNLAGDGTLAVANGLGFCMLELLPAVGRDSYRITAEARHLASDIPGTCGVYFARRLAAGGQGDTSLCTFLRFNDVWKAQDILDQDAGDIPKEFLKKLPVLGTNPVRIEALVVGDGVDAPREQSLALVEGAAFKPSGQRGPWHRLEVTVTPRRVAASWDGRDVGVLSAEKLTSGGQRVHAFWRKQRPERLGWLPEVPQAFPASGGLGLFVAQGSATFRKLVVSPLEELP
jgi:serine/threonine-protein kinase